MSPVGAFHTEKLGVVGDHRINGRPGNSAAQSPIVSNAGHQNLLHHLSIFF
jgi:hypothetical protein